MRIYVYTTAGKCISIQSGPEPSSLPVPRNQNIITQRRASGNPRMKGQWGGWPGEGLDGNATPRGDDSLIKIGGLFRNCGTAVSLARCRPRRLAPLLSFARYIRAVSLIPPEKLPRKAAPGYSGGEKIYFRDLSLSLSLTPFSRCRGCL